MTENTDNAQCMQCGVNSDDRVLISCLKEGGVDWVCVGCLPVLIHGVHG